MEEKVLKVSQMASNKQSITNDVTLLQSLKVGRQLIERLNRKSGLTCPVYKDNVAIQLNGNRNTGNVITTPESSQSSETLDNNNSEGITQDDILTTVSSLVASLDFALQQIQQLKYKSMIQHTVNNVESQSRIDVENNLQRQEFERVKTQLLIEQKHLLNKVKMNENKVKKYKKRIVEKNMEINRLAKLLNENITDTTHPDISSLDYSSSSISSSLRHTISTNGSYMQHSSNNMKKTSTMLRTLGVLASHVLKNNDDSDDNSVNRTLSLQTSKIEDENNTEAEISFSANNQHTNGTTTTINHHDNITNGQNSKNILGNHIPTLPPTTKFSNSGNVTSLNTEIGIPTQISQPEQPQKMILLPKMSSFSTVDGSIKN